MLLFPAGYFHFSKKAASYACGYPDSPTRLLREVPQAPFGTQIFNLWLRVLANAFGHSQFTAGCGPVRRDQQEPGRGETLRRVRGRVHAEVQPG